ncbi:hypothetical protein [Tuwongella immobilis]|uniref:Uncharacterized protein n=1 Tax=Tuwongella immobilis TaxID=692036 RepID=A0A6C2YVB5_9BACT|nr:hypothetical protein [Tuwongella immobilis]VIP04929.1 unnamed protein product [Tuwongella immobilis]VTS07216.1 unnamed protein product [Tuwongella immobilis]
MMRNLFALLALLTLSMPAWAKLELTQAVLAEGPVGPERKSQEFYPLDELVFRIGLRGVKVNDEGRCDLELSFRLVTPAGQTVIDQKGPVQRALVFGGGELTTAAIFLIGLNAPEGVYTARMTIKDKLSQEEVSLEKKLTCKKPGFRILTPRFFHDNDGKIAAAASGTISEARFFRLKVVGYSRANDQIRATMGWQILDADGSIVDSRPALIKAEITKPEEVRKAVQLNFNGMVYFNRPGKFTLRLIVNDLNAQQATQLDIPLEVTNP